MADDSSLCASPAAAAHHFEWQLRRGQKNKTPPKGLAAACAPAISRQRPVPTEALVHFKHIYTDMSFAESIFFLISLLILNLKHLNPKYSATPHNSSCVICASEMNDNLNCACWRKVICFLLGRWHRSDKNHTYTEGSHTLGLLWFGSLNTNHTKQNCNDIIKTLLKQQHPKKMQVMLDSATHFATRLVCCV